MSTPNRMQTHWPEVKQFIKRQWPLISETALTKINGNFDLFLKHLKEAYNNFPLEEARARDKTEDFINSISSSSNPGR